MKLLQPVLWAALCIGVGITASLLQADALRDWYPFLAKPPLTPPDWVFPVAWTTLYVMMGISIGLVRTGLPVNRSALTGIFLAQLAVNFLWSVLFFFLRSPAAGLVAISVLLVLLLLYIKQCLPTHRVAAILFVPYVLWVAFAWYLNVAIVILN